MPSITVDVSARITGYQESLKQLQQALSKVDPGTEIGKSLTKAFTNASQQVKELSKNMFPKASNELQIDKILGDVDRVGMMLDNVRGMFSGVSLQDLKLDGLTSEISNAMREMTVLQNSVTNTMNTGIRDAINNSTELKSLFTDLGKDVSQLTPESGQVALAEGLVNARKEAESASEALQKASDKVTRLQGDLDTKKSNSVFNPETFNLNSFTEQLKQAVPERIFDKDAFSQLRDSMMEAIDSRKLSDDVKSSLKQSFQSAFEGINDDTTVSQFRQTLNNLYQQLSNAGLSDNQIRSIMGTTDPNKIISQLFGFDSNALNAAKDQITNMLAPFQEKFTEKEKGKITNLINEGELEQATNIAIQAITNSQNKVVRTWDTATEKINEAKNKQQEAQTNLDNANQKVTSYEQGSANYNQVVTSLMSTVAAQTTKIAQLETQVQQLTQAELSKVQNGGGSPTSLLKPAIADAQKYKSELNQINSAQTAIGKMQSITQRWFSVYAAVRMVSKAIKTTINTTKELDATITDIAIVTNKSQDQLWGQMPQYTEMARQYGASISGVYKVSQLYYQQGLKQNDVMALSAETLKLARISGLEYSEATDYMTNAVRSFKMEMTDAQVVTDVYSAVAAKSATSVSEIATAMSKTASSAQAVGSSIQNTTAMMAVMIEATRESPENIGSAMKSIISRYGELKENKTGIDEEGEEYSLNKVDKALQSVGLTLHDAQGQFRNFDDVIMELAASWDTIDTNTQRYIATVMAGNRQQSRFLALVSSYSRLKELSQEAADSEGASQMQFLKTIDSIEYKSQQLQTSLQSLYTESGIQDLIKSTLDGANNIIQTFTNLPKTFDLPLAAITKFGIQFANIAKIVTTAFGLIKTGIASQIDAIRQKGIKGAQEAANREVEIVRQKNVRIMESEQELAAYKEARAQDKTPAEEKAYAYGKMSPVYEKTTRPMTTGERIKSWFGNGRGTALASLGLSLAGTALTGISMGMEDTPNNRLWKGITGLLGSTATGAGMGSMFGLPGMAIGGIIGSISGLVQAIDVWHEDAAEKTKRLEGELKTAQDKNTAKKSEYKTLNNEIQEYKRLSEARLDSADAMQEYIDKCNQLAEDHPDLISGYDAEGNAIINLTEAYKKLQKAKEGQIETGIEEADTAFQSARAKTKQVTEEYNREVLKTVDNNVGQASWFNWSNATAEEFTPIIDAIDIGNRQAFKEAIDTITEASQKGQKEYAGAINDNLAILKETRNQWKNVSESESLFGFIDTLIEREEAGKTTELKKKKNLSEQAQYAEEAVYTVQGSALASNYISDYLLRDEIKGTSNYKYLSEFKNAQTLAGRYLAQQAEDSKSDNYAAEESLKDFLEIDGAIKDFWNKNSQKNKDILDNLISSQADYTQSETETILEDLGIGTDNPIYSAIMSYYSNLTSGFKDVEDIVLNAQATKRDKSNIGKLILGEVKTIEQYAQDILAEDSEISKEEAANQAQGMRDNAIRENFYSQLGENEQRAIASFYNTILDKIDDQTISGDMGYSMMENYINIWKQLTSDKLFDNKQIQQKVQSLFRETDFTSQESIDNFLTNLNDLGIKLSDLGLDESNFELSFPANFASSIQTFGNTMTAQMSDFEKDMSNATKGMDFSEASKMAEKLDISLTKFRQQGNKFFLDDFNAIEEYYFKDREEKIEELQKIQEEELAAYSVAGDSNSRTYFKNAKDINMNVAELFKIGEEWNQGWQDNIDTLFNMSPYISSLQKAGVDPKRYKSYIEKWKKEAPDQQFEDYMAANFKEESDAYIQASSEALNYTLASTALASGRIEDFVRYSSYDQLKAQAKQKLQEEGALLTISDLESLDQQIAEAESNYEQVDTQQAIDYLQNEKNFTVSQTEYDKKIAEYNAQLDSFKDLRGKTASELEAEKSYEITSEDVDAKVNEMAWTNSDLLDIASMGLLNILDGAIQLGSQLQWDLLESTKPEESDYDALQSEAEESLMKISDTFKQFAVDAYQNYLSNPETLNKWVTETLRQAGNEDIALGLEPGGKEFEETKKKIIDQINATGMQYFYDTLINGIADPKLREGLKDIQAGATAEVEEIRKNEEANIEQIEDQQNAMIDTASHMRLNISEEIEATSDRMSDRRETEARGELETAQQMRIAEKEQELDSVNKVIAEAQKAKDTYIAENTPYTSEDIVDGQKDLNSAALKQQALILEEEKRKLLGEYDETTTKEAYKEYLLKRKELSDAIDSYNEQIIEDRTEEQIKELTKEVAKGIKSGDFSYFSGDMAQFEATARKAYTDTWTSITNSMSDAIEGGAQEIEVTDANKDALLEMARKGYLDIIGKAEIVDGAVELITGANVTWKDLKEKSEQDIVDLVNGLTLPEKTKSQMLQQWHEALYPDKLSELNTLMSGESFDYSSLDTYFKDFSTITDFGTNLSEYGLALNEVTGKYDIKESAKYFTKLRDDLNKLDLDINSDEYRDALAQIDSAERQYQAKSTSKLNTAVKDVLDNYDNISEDQYTALQSALSVEQWQKVQQAFTHMADGTHKVNAGQLLDILKGFNLSDIIYDTANTSISNIKDDYLKNLTTATSLVIQGTANQADVQKFIDSAKQLGINAQDAFSYDSLLNAWTLDPQVMKNYIQTQGQKLVDEGLLSVEEANEYVNKNVAQALAGTVDIKSFLDSETRTGETREKLAQNMENYYKSFLPKSAELWPEQDIKEYMEYGARSLANADIKLLEDGGYAAAQTAQKWAIRSGKELTSADIESAYRAQVSQIENSFEQLITGPGGIVTGTAKTILETLQSQGKASITALDANNAVVNSITDIAAAYQEYYNLLAKSGEATLESLNNAKAKVLETKGGRDKEQKAIDALGDAAGMTYSTFGQLMTDMGIELTDDLMNSLESSGIIESLGGTKMRIKDFASFARAMKWDFNSEEYIDAFSTYNDGLIERNKKIKEATTQELEGLKDIKPGDQLNLTKTEKAFKDFSKSREAYIKQAEWEVGMTNSMEANYLADQYALEDTFFNNLQNTLHEYGAYLQDGILNLSEDANLLGVAETLKAAALESGSTMSAELADMVQSIVDSYTDAITKGIEGGMTNAEKENLIRKGADMGIQHKESDFYQTAEGWQMSTQAGMKYYATMSKIDNHARKKIYNSLSKTLKETNNNYKTATSMLGRMTQLTEELNKLTDVSLSKANARKEELSSELEILREMYANSLSHKDDSWDFLSQNPFPEGMDNALTFWENVGNLQYQMGQWNLRKKVDDMSVLAAGFKEAYKWSQALGESVDYMGMKVGDQPGAKDLNTFLSEYTKYTYYNPKTGRVESTANMLSQWGFNLALGSKGVDTGAATKIAERNAEIVEAFQSFGESMLGIQNTLKDYSNDDFQHSFEDFVENGTFSSKDFLKQMQANSKNYANFMKFADKVHINGDTLKNILQSSSGQIKDTDQNFKALQGLFKAALSDGVDLEHSYQAVAEILSSNGFEGQIQLADTTYEINGGRAIFKNKKDSKWTGPNGEQFDTPTQAWDAFNKADIEDLQSQLNQYSQEQSDNGKYEIKLDGATYEVIAEQGKIKVREKGKSSKSKEYSSIAEWQNAEYQEYKKGLKDNQALSQEAWWNKQTQSRAPEFKANTGRLTSAAQQAMQSAGLTSGEAIQNAWNQMYDQYGSDAVYEWEAKYKFKPELDGKGNISDDVAAQIADTVNFDNIAASVTKGISQAFTGKDTAGGIRQAISGAISDGLGGASEDGTVPIKFKGETENVPPKYDENLTGSIDYTGNIISLPDVPNLSGTITYTGYVVGTPGISGKGGCFVAGTQIIMADGSTKNIEEIQIGEYVIAYNDELKQFEPRSVIKSYPHKNTPRVLDITLSNGIILGITPGHPILTTTGWKSRDIANSRYEHNTIADWLNIGDQVIGYEGNTRVLAIKERVIPKHYITYNIEVETCHTFVADGIVVHNAKATGTVGLAHAKSTLMGELGPEMVVSNGRYFVAGQNGPEFVDLADDAIVFNHLQTQSLLEKGTSSTRGRAITNERNAVSYAKGNINGGPAHDWENFTDYWRTVAETWSGGPDLLNNGKGGSAPEAPDLGAFIKDLERWYNWLQRIAKLETEISYQEALRSKYESSFSRTGADYYNSQIKSLEKYNALIKENQSLVQEQQAFLEKRLAELQNGAFGKLYDVKDKQVVYKSNDIRDRFMEEFGASDSGAPNHNAQEQYEWLQRQGLGEYLKYDSSGKEIKFENEGKPNPDAWRTGVESALSRLDKERDEIQGLIDSIDEHTEAIETAEAEQNAIYKEMEDNQISVENKVMNAVVEKHEREIELLEDQRDALEKNNQALLDGLNRQLDNERNLYQNQQNKDELSTLQRQLSILERSGGSASEIASLKEQIEGKQYDVYFDTQEDMINNLQEAMDTQIEKLDTQIDLMTETLDYQKEYGLLWNEVNQILEGTPESISEYIKTNTEAYWGKSTTDLAQTIRQDLFEIDQFKQLQKDGGLYGLIQRIADKVAPQAAPVKSTSSEPSSGGSGSSSGGGSPRKKNSSNPYKVTSESNNLINSRDQMLATLNTNTGQSTNTAIQKNYTQAVEKEKKRIQNKANKIYIQGNAFAKGTLLGELGPEAYVQNGQFKVAGLNGAEMIKLKKDAVVFNHQQTAQLISSGHTNGRATPVTSVNAAVENNAQEKYRKAIEEQMRKQQEMIKKQQEQKLAMLKQRQEQLQKQREEMIKQQQARAKAAATQHTSQSTQTVSQPVNNNHSQDYRQTIQRFWETVERNKHYVNSINNLNYPNTSALSSIMNNNDAVIIENASVNMNIEKLADDYDAQRAGEQALARMLEIARKSSSQNRIGR